MSAHTPDVNDVIDSIPDRKVPAAVNGALGALVLLGLGAAGYGFAVAGAAYAWGAILVGILYTLALAQGGVMLSVIQTGTWGRWGRPIKRIAEVFGLYMPFGWAAMMFFLVAGGLTIYTWNPHTIIPSGPVNLAPHSPEVMASKPWWLTTGAMTLRLALGVGLLTVLDLIYIRASIKPDVVMAAKRLGAKASAFSGLWGVFSGGETDVARAVASGQGTQSRIFPFIGIAFGLVMSLVHFDLVMSLAPLWVSNLFGGYLTVSGFWVSLAALGFVSMLARDWLGLGEWIKPNVTHDLGKLMLAGTMFWGYTTFAQLLPIYYTNMPEETDYLMVRMMLPQWSWLAQLVGMTCFVAPFTILLSRGIKKLRWPFLGICSLIMVGVFFERSLHVLPQVWLGDAFPTANFLVVSVGVWLGFLGFFGLVVVNLLARLPPLVVSDPHLGTHPWDEHIGSLDVAHHPH